MRVIRTIVKKIIGVLPRREVKVPVYIPVYNTELLKNRTALITGGTSGIGFAIAKAFIKSGASVIVTGRRQDKLDLALTALRNMSGESRANGIILDNASVSQFEDKIDELCDVLGTPDILVNNAGVINCDAFGGTSEKDYDVIMDINLKGSYFLSQTLSKKWVSNKIKGHILNVCSSSSLRPGNNPYVLSKWGLRALTIGMAKELIPYGITVNGIAPGPTATSMFVGDGKNGITWNKNPSHRLVTEEEIANMAVILASDMGRMIVGDILYISGGAGVITFDDV